MRELLRNMVVPRDIEGIKTFLAEGGDTEEIDPRDHRKVTALHIAAQQCDIEIATILLNAGADIEAKNAYGNTPLWVAVMSQGQGGPMIRFLLEEGANPNEPCNKGVTPFEMAQGIGNHDMVQFFKGYVDSDEIESYYEMIKKYNSDTSPN